MFCTIPKKSLQKCKNIFDIYNTPPAKASASINKLHLQPNWNLQLKCPPFCRPLFIFLRTLCSLFRGLDFYVNVHFN